MDHIESVNIILQEIESTDKPCIMIFNKIDAFTYNEPDEFDLELTEENYDLAQWKRTWMNKGWRTSCLYQCAGQKQY
jgi:GTP-binding protein HflX